MALFDAFGDSRATTDSAYEVESKRSEMLPRVAVSMLAQWSRGSLEARHGQDSAVRKGRALYS
jgi:hypothetical protein